MNSWKALFKTRSFIGAGLGLVVSFFAIPAANATGDLARISGSNRTGTAIATCQRLYPSDDSAGAIILTRADQFPDALSAASLAGTLRGCILLNSQGNLETSNKNEIDRVLPANGSIFLIGGTSALSPAIENNLGSYQVSRLAGRDRYETAKKIKEQVDTLRGFAATSAIIASGQDFPDALSASSFAALSGTPILLTKSAQLPTETATALSASVRSAFVIGGPQAISDSVLTAIEDAVSGPALRIAGADRYATSIAVADIFFATPLAITATTGTNFPDALAGGVLAGLTPLAQTGTPIILTKPNSVPGTVSSYLVNHSTTLDDDTSGYILGGNSAISSSAESALEKLL